MGHHAVGDEVMAAVRGLVGDDASVTARTDRGESRSTFLVNTSRGGFVLKVSPDGASVLANQQRLIRIVGALRQRGYPAPDYLGAGRAGGVVFSIQRQLPGRLLEPGPGKAPPPVVFEGLLPQLLAAIDLQADAGDLEDPPWPDWLVDTNLHGGQGYCLHETMRARVDTSALLDRVLDMTRRAAQGPVRRGDVVHFDLNPANILHEDGRLTGVIDWNAPFTGAVQGDRGFDIATLLFYSYDLPATRGQLWDHAIATSGPRWACVHLAHLCLRQVEWSVRHRAGTDEEARFLRIARQVLEDCERLLGPRGVHPSAAP